MSQPARTRFRDAPAIPAALAALAMIAVPSAVSNADKRTVRVEVAFVDRVEIARAPADGEDAPGIGQAAADAASPGERAAPSTLTRFNVVTTPGRPLTVQIAPAAGDSAALPAGLVCSFGSRRGLPCDRGGVTVTSGDETEFRLDGPLAPDARSSDGAASATLLEVTVAYQ